MDLFSFVLLLLFLSVVAYKSSYLQKKTWGQFSLIQIIYLIILPAIMFMILYSYAQSIVARPYASQVFIPDQILVNIILLSMFYTYGGLAIHAVTKMLAKKLRHYDDEVARTNRYFHLNFSHNLTFSGAIVIMTGLTLLEFNHISTSMYHSWISPVGRGLLLGLVLVSAMYIYTKSDDNYYGRWSDLKITFMVSWLALFVILYAVRRFDPMLTEYQLLVPALTSFMITIVFTVFLLVKSLYTRFVKKSRLEQEVFENTVVTDQSSTQLT